MPLATVATKDEDAQFDKVNMVILATVWDRRVEVIEEIIKLCLCCGDEV